MGAGQEPPAPSFILGKGRVSLLPCIHDHPSSPDLTRDGKERSCGQLFASSVLTQNEIPHTTLGNDPSMTQVIHPFAVKPPSVEMTCDVM